MAENARYVPADDGRIFDIKATRPGATLDELYRTRAKKAEIVDGRVVVMSPGGGAHGYAALEITAQPARARTAHATRSCGWRRRGLHHEPSPSPVLLS